MLFEGIVKAFEEADGLVLSAGLEYALECVEQGHLAPLRDLAEMAGDGEQHPDHGLLIATAIGYLVRLGLTDRAYLAMGMWGFEPEAFGLEE